MDDGARRTGECVVAPPDTSRRAAVAVAVNAGAFFSLSLVQMMGLAVPLWTAEVDVSPLWVGVIVGARSVLPFLYSIHLGALMDAIGAKRVMLAFAGGGTILPLLYPVFPQVGPLIVLQLLMGLIATACWLGSQMAIGVLARGDVRRMGFFSVITTFGSFAGPLLLGLAWDAGGAWLGFAMISLWSAGLFVSTACLPMQAGLGGRRRVSLRDMLPDLASYIKAVALLRESTVRFVVGATFLRLAFISMQESFYSVHLEERGFSASVIGILIGISWLVSTPSALLAAPAVRLLGSPRVVLLISNAVAIAGIAATPVLPNVWLLGLGACAFGLGQGIGFPLVISILSAGVRTEDQGLSAGVRATANRLSAVIVPLGMGMAAQSAGLAPAFGIVGAALLGMLGLLALTLRRS